MTDLFNQPSYYNTNNEVGDTLQKSKAKAVSQEEDIKILFQCFPTKSDNGFTADEIADEFYDFSGVPITSIRRALTNLCGEKWNNFLVKTDVMRMGKYGKLTHAYKIRNNG
jgi:hypothetical protein